MLIVICNMKFIYNYSYYRQTSRNCNNCLFLDKIPMSVQQFLVDTKTLFWNCIAMREGEDTFGNLKKLLILRLSIAIQQTTNASPVVVNTPISRWHYDFRFQTAILQGIRPIALGCWPFCQKSHILYLYISIYYIGDKSQNLKMKRQIYYCKVNTMFRIQIFESY